MVLLTNDEFLAQLSTLFEAKQGKGTVFVTQKRRAYFCGASSAEVFSCRARPLTTPSLSLSPPLCTNTDTPRKGSAAGLPCSLVRATDGAKRKLSTLVTLADAPTFHPSYVAVLKGSMTSLKKLKKAKKQAIAKQGAL
jgi:hypothetical protein